MLPVLLFAAIGFAAGILAKKFMPGRIPDKTISLGLLGIVGGVAGGLLTLLLFSYGRAQVYLSGYTHVYSDDNGATLPAYWMSPFSAIVGAVLVVAVYKLIKTGRARA